MKKITAALLALFVISGICFARDAGKSSNIKKRILWSDSPVVFSEKQAENMRYSAQQWSRNIFPMGNGRLGCTVFGDPKKERIQFNEDSMWVGNEDCTGGYQPFGDVYIEMPHKEFSNYRRELDISRALQTVTYTSGGVKFKRQYFSSYPAQVMVFRFTADKPGALSGKIWLDHLHRSKVAKMQLKNPKAGDAITTTARGNTLTMAGSTADLFFWQLHTMPEQQKRILGLREYASNKNIDLDFEAQLRVLNEGGRIKVVGDSITFEKCNTLTILLGADTSYLNQRDKGWRGEHPHGRITADLDAATKRSYDELLAEHVKDYQNLYGRFALSLGETPKALTALPTAQRVAAYQEQFKQKSHAADRDLEALLYQYARYLMISCSRPGHGGLPANLQGLWLYHFRPAWRCDYHTDINLQMNYWFVDQANISECFTPLAEWLDSIRQVRKEETRKVLGVKRGWLMRSENGVFGGSTYHFQKGDSAWICQNLWDHYAFTQDKEYLQRHAYPVMKEISEFWVDHLKELADGTLVAPDGRSPEHGPEKADGVTYDQQLCWDLFTNMIEASEVLGVDAEYRKELIAKRKKLLGPKVGKWGQLQEWMEDIDDPKDTHRHINHMVGVYPGRQIHPTTTPKFAEAAKVGLIARGNGRTGWSKAWKISIFARLLEAERAYAMLSDLMAVKLYGNLWTTHPPFQIDCNFGYPAGVNEMLAQSHMGYIHLLPALPKAWANGSIKGMRLRGGYELDMQWKDGKLIQAVLTGISNKPNKVKIRYGDTTKTFEIAKGSKMILPADKFSAGRMKPNFIFVLSDDIAQGDLGCYGQELIKTPRLDQMAAEGTRFMQAYCGTSVCAPSRSSFFTGLHVGHCPVRGNYEVPPEGQLPLPEKTVTIAEVAKSAGYATATFGKWGMGFFDSTGSPMKQGVDHFFGYNCQRHAHSYFPTYLYDDDQPFLLPGNDGQKVGKTYAQELIQNDMIKWLKANGEKPFMMFYAITLPHGRHEIDDFGIYKDKPWSNKEKAYAAQVTRIDSDMGELVDTLRKLGIDKNTLIVFSGDNGSSFPPKSEIGKRFNQARNGLRGFKRGMYEGALRQAAFAWWPGTVPAGRVDDQPWAFWDLMPTFVEMSGATPPKGYETDGLSLVDYLKGGKAPKRDYFYWELHPGKYAIQAARFDKWKAVRNGINKPIEIYNLTADSAESKDLAKSRPDLVKRAAKIFAEAHRPDPNWPLDHRSKKHIESSKEAWKIKRWRDKNKWVPENARKLGE